MERKRDLRDKRKRKRETLSKDEASNGFSECWNTAAGHDHKMQIYGEGADTETP